MVGTTHVENNCGYETIKEVRLDVEETSTCSSQVDSPSSLKKEIQDMYRISLKARNNSQSGLKPVDITSDQLGNGITSRGTSLHSRLETVDVHLVNASGIAEEEVGTAEGSKSDDENIEKETILSSYACNEENVDSSTEDIKGKKNSAEHGCKKSNIASSKKKFKVRHSKKMFKVRPGCGLYMPIKDISSMCGLKVFLLVGRMDNGLASSFCASSGATWS
jgi:hypothetical protein